VSSDNPPTDGTPIEITPRAVAHILRTMVTENAEGKALRLAVVEGGCSGHEYLISFADQVTPGDREYVVGDLRVLLAGDSIAKLAGTVLDYEDGLYGAGLKFRNPQAVSQCGCGASFSTG